MSGAARVRLARITDLAALAALSRSATRSLGLPIAVGALSLFRLARMPLSLLRPTDLIWVHERSGALDGFARVERDERGDWSLVELAGSGEEAGDVRHALLGRAAREAARSGVERIYVACAERDGNFELLASNAFQPYTDEMMYLRAPVPSDESLAASAALRPAEASDGLRLSLHHHAVTPAAVARMEAIDVSAWDRLVRGTWAPRSCVTPLLRLVEGTTFIVESGVESGAPEIGGWIQIGVAREEGTAHPHALRISLAPGVNPGPIIAAGLGEIARRAAQAGTAANATLVVRRSYEGGLEAALEGAGFTPAGELRLLVREVRGRVSAQGLLPAVG